MYASKESNRKVGAKRHQSSALHCDHDEFTLILAKQMSCLRSVATRGDHKELEVFFRTLNSLLSEDGSTVNQVLELVDSVNLRRKT